MVNSMSRRLDERCPLRVKRAYHNMIVEPDTAYIMPGGHHGEVVEEDGDVKIILNKGPKVNYARPSIDVLMKSVAEVFDEKSVGTLLTGMGVDGAMGMKAIKEAGGATIAQDKETSAVFTMPRAAIELGCVDKVVPLQNIPDEIVKILEKKV